MLIPYDLLEAETLTNLIEDFVTRDGTDNGDETPLQTRVQRVRHALERGWREFLVLWLRHGCSGAGRRRAAAETACRAHDGDQVKRMWVPSPAACS